MNDSKRLISLDFFRGFTMLLLISGGVLQYFSAAEYEGTIAHVISTQFTHPDWEGFRFWDLIQPFFMFIVGMAIPFSIAKRLSSGESWAKLTRHAATRSLVLILLGVTLNAAGNGFNLTFQNVLSQIGITYFIAFLLIRTKPSVQLAVSIGLIVLTEILYRLFPMESGQPFVMGKTFGDYVNQIIAPGSSGHWASFNAVPTAAHTIWGALCGQLLRKDLSGNRKLIILLIGGMIALITGYALTFISPIIKRICTSSFVFLSGGFAIFALALTYWIIDIREHKKWALFGVVVGMNPIFIYLFASSIKSIVYKFTEPWIKLIFSWIPENFIEIFMLTLAWFFNWYICYFLYKKNIFIRI
jgi:predicted acyltransferase